MKSNLIKSKIKSREVEYYLASEADLKAIKSNGVLGAICLTLFSFFLSSSVSEQNWILLAASLIFLLFAIYFEYSWFSPIKDIKHSGSFKEIEESNEQLEIIKGNWGIGNTPKDVTQILIDLISDNMINTKAHISIFGDPNPTKRKNLTIKYRYRGLENVKTYVEDDPIVLP